MGCGGTKELYENDFYYEVFEIDDKYSSDNQYVKSPNFQQFKIGDVTFLRELTDGNEESYNSRPWLREMVPFTSIQAKNVNCNPPAYILKPDHVFGIKLKNIRNNLFSYKNDQLLYASGSCTVLENLSDKSQIIFGCDERNFSKRLCHNGPITAIDFLDGPVSFVATGQRGLKPTVLIWSPNNATTIYGKYCHKRGSKEVSGVSLDKEGKFVVSFGRDDKNTFYVYEMQTQEIIKTVETGNNKILWIEYGYRNKDIIFVDNKPQNFDPATNTDEICICGFKCLYFYNIKSGSLINIAKNNKIEDNIFTYCHCFTHRSNQYYTSHHWLIGNYKGDIFYFYRGNFVDKFEGIIEGSIEIIKYCPKNGLIYITDAKQNVYNISKKNSEKNDMTLNFGCSKLITTKSICKGLTVSPNGDIYFALKNGIILRKYKNDKNEDQTDEVLRTHWDGGVYGLDVIDEKRIITTGEDNLIIVWNINSNKAEFIGKIGEDIELEEKDTYFKSYTVKSMNKSWTVSVNKNNGEICIGICNGNISIRQAYNKIDKKVVNDIDCGRNEISEVKYSLYGNLLAVATLSGDIYILNPLDKYKKIKNISITNQIGIYALTMDWDKNNEFIQMALSNNYYEILKIELPENQKEEVKILNLKGIKKDSEKYDLLLKSEWPNITCKFGYSVQGIFQGSNDCTFISSCCKADNANLLCVGDNDYCLTLMNYPAMYDNCKTKRYYAHADNIKRIRFINNDKKVITIGGKDNTIISWNIISNID